MVKRSQAARAQINLRHWPGRSGWQLTENGSHAPGLSDRLVLYLLALPERGVIPERLGLGAWLVALGSIVVATGVFYDDSLAEPAFEGLARWASGNALDTPLGVCAMGCDPLSVFNQTVLRRHGYVGRMPIVGPDLGRTLGVLADWWVPARRRGFKGGWSLGLRGWGVVVDDGAKRRWSTSYGQPKLYIKAVGAHSLVARFGWPRSNPEGMRRGVWVRGPTGHDVPYPGTFIDLIGASFALDGVDSGELDDHLVAWGMEPLRTPYATEVTPEGATTVHQCVVAVHRLALAVDAEAAQWG
jgi:hypothetical protein